MNDHEQKSKRWIAMTVDSFDHPLLQSKEFDRRSAFEWLIANAAWKDHHVRTRGGIVEIKRGEVVVGLDHLSKTWGWSVKRVRTFLGELADHGMISKGQAKNQYATVVSICNYGKYQTVGAHEGQAKGKREASEGHAKGNTLTKDTNTTRDTKETNYPSNLESAREAADSPPPVDDADFVLAKKLFDAAGDAIRFGATSIHDLTPIKVLLKEGADLEKHVLPAIRMAVSKRDAQSVSSWRYFEKPIRELAADGFRRKQIRDREQREYDAYVEWIEEEKAAGRYKTWDDVMREMEAVN